METFVSIAIALVVLGLAFGLIRWAFGFGGPPMDGSMMAGAFSVVGLALMVFFMLALAGMVIWAVFAFAGAGQRGPWWAEKDWASFGAVSELKKRYARGLVSREEYLRVLSDLEPHHPPAAAQGGDAPPVPAGSAPPTVARES